MTASRRRAMKSRSSRPAGTTQRGRSAPADGVPLSRKPVERDGDDYKRMKAAMARRAAQRRRIAACRPAHCSNGRHGKSEGGSQIRSSSAIPAHLTDARSRRPARHICPLARRASGSSDELLCQADGRPWRSSAADGTRTIGWLRGIDLPPATSGLPTPRTTLRARYVSLLVWCKGGCQHQADADLQALIDAGAATCR